MKRIVLILLIAALLGGCKRYNFDYADIKSPKDQPEYNLKLDRNDYQAVNNPSAAAPGQ